MSKIQLPEFELPDLSQVSWQEVHDAVREYGKRCIELDRASRPAGEAVAWLHDVVQGDGEQDQALSFSPDSFPLKGVGGFESIKSTPLFLAPQATHNKCDADFVALQIARRFVPYLEPQRRAQLQVAIRDAICKATDLELAQAERIEELETLLKDIGNYAHDHSTGPAVPDALWTIRKMAYDG